MAVPVTGDRGQAVILAARRGQPPPVARAHQCLIQLAFDHRLDEAAHPIAHPSFDRDRINRRKDTRRSRDASRRPSCSPATRPGASPPISPSCRSCCVGPEHRATTRHSVISITLTAARRWQPRQRRAEGLLHCYLSPLRPRPRACRSAPVVGATPAQRLLFYVRRRGACR